MSEWHVTPMSPPPFVARLPVVLLRHSGPGIASFVIGLVAGIFLLLDFVVAGFVQLHRGGVVAERDPVTILIGLAIIFFLFVALIGLILGIVGAAQSQRRKLFAWLGLGLNLLLIVGTLGLMAFGYAIRHR